ncbi:MAG TPA: nuclear transport factor 2 family protein [Gemmatimonadaceae bacterium]
MTLEADLARMMSVAAEESDAEIIEAEARIRSAQLSGDIAELDALIADEILFTGPTGELGTKAQDLDAYRSGAVRFVEHEPEELKMLSVSDDVMVSALRARLAVEAGGAVVRGLYRYTRVWVRAADGKWRVSGGHVSEVPAIL